MIDVAIIGAGPAGSAAALSLAAHAPHLTVAILDAGSLRTRKPGEILPAAAAPILRTLDAWDAFQAAGFLADPVIASAWGGAELIETHSLYSARGAGWRLDRTRFDRLLAGVARAHGAQLQLNWRVRTLTGEPGDWRLTAADGRTLTARAIILATGRSPRLPAQLAAARPSRDRLVGAVRFCRAGDDPRTLIETFEHGWWYSAPVASGLRAVACMTDADQVRALGLASPTAWRRAATPAIAAAVSRLGPLRVWPAGGSRLTPAAGPGWAAAGDAAVSFDPLSSQGITQALRGGAFAGFAAADMLAGDAAGAVRRLEAHVTATWAAYSQTHADTYAREDRWPGSPFWLRRRGRALAVA
ncbi:flavin-dependent dehydrogenase [Caulobacter ginsengisoli]|uniref:Flavin-dependent dehydrogenase n=1 Tax=Caulobacter ginsengisoli TaxID=400775 RepID=A0ABU0IL08_9CAUL|nr:FAD-dependent oxidoreductase [Caulobacter ginsengisoli]MDQ0462649.1 flavin-dependent dehydrogenase [Caulobacter ginsengisoli]